MTTWLLVAAAVAVQVDLVRSGFSLERARAHDRQILRTLALATAVLLTVDLAAGLVLSLGVLGYWREGSLRNLLLAAGLAAVWLVAPILEPWAWVIALGWLTLALIEAAITLWFWGAAKRWWPARTTFAETLPLWPLAGFRGQHTYFAAGLALLAPLAWALYPALGVCWMLMLIGISSWVGVLAGLVGVAFVAPMLSPVIGAAILTALLLLLPRFRHDRPSWLDVLPRGDSLDSVRERGRSWRFLLGTMRRWSWRTWLTGRGWDGPNQGSPAGARAPAGPAYAGDQPQRRAGPGLHERGTRRAAARCTGLARGIGPHAGGSVEWGRSGRRGGGARVVGPALPVHRRRVVVGLCVRSGEDRMSLGRLRLLWVFWSAHWRCEWLHVPHHRIDDRGKTTLCGRCGRYWVRDWWKQPSASGRKPWARMWRA